MQYELNNKASIFVSNSLAARWLNDTVKRKGFNDFFDNLIILSRSVHLVLSEVSTHSRPFYKFL